MQGEFVIVDVGGLDERGNLKAEPGDTVTLTCRAKGEILLTVFPRFRR